MPTVKRGDLILIDFIAKIKETEEIFDTTDKDTAKKHGIFRESTIYEPMLVAIGNGWVIKGLDEALIGLKVGERKLVEVPPEKGMGLRDPNKIKLYPLSRFKHLKRKLRPGMWIEVKGVLGMIRSISAGRVQIDFNPPLAGKTIIYDLIVRKVLKSKREKLKALIHRRMPKIDLHNFKITMRKDKVCIELPESALFLRGLQFIKRALASDIQKYVGIDKVVFIESYGPT